MVQRFIVDAMGVGASLDERLLATTARSIVNSSGDAGSSVARALNALGANGGTQPGGEVLLQLGDYQFSVRTAAHQSLSRDAAWRWAEQDVLGHAPELQYVGPGGQGIEISGYLLPHWSGGYLQLDALRAQADKGEPLLLAVGSGDVLGYWCITAIKEGQTQFDPVGKPRRVEFTVSLRRYGDRLDRLNAAGVQ